MDEGLGDQQDNHHGECSAHDHISLLAKPWWGGAHDDYFLCRSLGYRQLAGPGEMMGQTQR
jgi:hypothetical protein